MGSQRTSCEEKKHLKNVPVGRKKPLRQFECQKRRVNLTYQLWKSLGVCKLWDNVALSSQTFFPIYFSVCLSSQCPGILLLYGHRYAEIWENVTFFFSPQQLFFLFLWMEIAMCYSFPCLFDKAHYLCLSLKDAPYYCHMVSGFVIKMLQSPEMAQNKDQFYLAFLG